MTRELELEVETLRDERDRWKQLATERYNALLAQASMSQTAKLQVDKERLEVDHGRAIAELQQEINAHEYTRTHEVAAQNELVRVHAERADLQAQVASLRSLEKGYRRTKHLWNRRKKVLLEAMRNHRADFVRKEMERSEAIQFGSEVFRIRWVIDDECKCIACEGLRALVPHTEGREFLRKLPHLIGSNARAAVGRALRDWGNK